MGENTNNKRQKLNQPSKDFYYNYNEAAEPLIPDEIMFDILIRVPARDLVSSFKRVCKSWNDMISSREFSKAHLKYWRSKFDVILLQGVFPDHDFVSLDIRTETTHQLSFRSLVNGDSVIILDSLDGLILLHDTYFKNQLYVCNPLTQKFKLIAWDPFYASFRTFYKLVFDFALQKYKVIGFCYQSENPRFALKYCVIKLSGDNDDDDGESKALVWRNVETRFQHLLRLQFNSVLVNGSLCWLAHSMAESVEDDRMVYVQAMDIAEEVFKEKIKLPCQSSYSTECKLLQMENVEGTLCVAIHEGANELGIWVLKDWNEHIWVKKYSIYDDGDGDKFFSQFHFSRRFSILFVMDASADDTEEVKFIVKIRGKLCSYSLKGECEEVNPKGSPKFTYVPSLICWD